MISSQMFVQNLTLETVSIKGPYCCTGKHVNIVHDTPIRVRT